MHERIDVVSSQNPLMFRILIDREYTFMKKTECEQDNFPVKNLNTAEKPSISTA